MNRGVVIAVGIRRGSNHAALDGDTVCDNGGGHSRIVHHTGATEEGLTDWLAVRVVVVGLIGLDILLFIFMIFDLSARRYRRSENELEEFKELLDAEYQAVSTPWTAC